MSYGARVESPGGAIESDRNLGYARRAEDNERGSVESTVRSDRSGGSGARRASRRGARQQFTPRRRTPRASRTRPARMRTRPTSRASTSRTPTTGSITFHIAVSNRPALTSDMLFLMWLDTDANPATGDPQSLGADYALQLEPGGVGLFKWNGTTYRKRALGDDGHVRLRRHRRDDPRRRPGPRSNQGIQLRRRRDLRPHNGCERQRRLHERA